MDDWIPVTERLPEGEDAMSCEAWCAASDDSPAGPCVMTYDADEELGHRWQNREVMGCWTPGDVTHWRPRPKAPHGQGLLDARPWHPTPAAQAVLAERRRQIDKEGWDAKHDDKHADHSMAHAAACYAAHDTMATRARQEQVDAAIRGECPIWRDKRVRVPLLWPSSWHSEWWKPKDRRSDLVRAGALILAEIERLDRAVSAKE
jgi:hypothetical protein